MKNCNLRQYLKIKGSKHNPQQKTPIKMFFRGVCSEPDIKTISINFDSFKATVLYYIAATQKGESIDFAYHYIILYPENYYVRGTYANSSENSFKQYLNELVMCHFVDCYYNPVPSMQEAVIFNHI